MTIILFTFSGDIVFVLALTCCDVSEKTYSDGTDEAGMLKIVFAQ